jgi:DNA-binding transcriptional LysR family regulator
MGLDELDAVLAVARRRNFRAAAAELNVSRSALSHSVAALEARLGARLFHRTTRSVSLTEVGTRFVEAITGPLAEIRSAMTQVNTASDQPRGLLRLNMAVSAARHLAGFFADYLRRNPEMRLDIVTDNSMVDVVDLGFDAGVRIREMVPRDMIAVPVGDVQRLVVVASPTYLAGRSMPRTPMDLKEHLCIRGRIGAGPIWRWEFHHQRETVSMEVNGPMIVNDTDVMVNAAVKGAGLAYVSAWSVTDHLAAGRLVEVLADWAPAYSPFCIYYPGRRLIPSGLRALLKLAKDWR